MSFVGALRRCSGTGRVPSACDEGARRVVGRVHGVRLRRDREVDDGLGERELALGRAEPLVGLGGVERESQRARVGEADVLARHADHAARDVAADRRRRRACAPSSRAPRPGPSRAPTCAAPRSGRRSSRRPCRSAAASPAASRAGTPQSPSRALRCCAPAATTSSAFSRRRASPSALSISMLLRIGLDRQPAERLGARALDQLPQVLARSGAAARRPRRATGARRRPRTTGSRWSRR